MLVTNIKNLIPNPKHRKLQYLRKLDVGLYEEIMSKTDFLAPTSNLSIRLKFVEGNHTTLIKCKTCHNEHQRLDDKKNISLYCSSKCFWNDDNKNYEYLKKIDQSKKMRRLRETNKFKYGYEYNSQRPDVKKNILSKSKLERTNPSALKKLNDIDWMREQYEMRKLTSVEIGTLLNIHNGTVIDYLIKHGIDIKYNINKSAMERELESYLRELNINVITSDRIILAEHKLELDILCPDHNFAIELNGLYWHSYTEFNDNKNKHILKANLCQSKNITLFQFTDEQWLTNKNICLSMIKNKIGLSHKIYARKCDVRELSPKEYRNFVEINHIARVAPAKIKLGLYHNNELVMVMSFSKPRFNKNYEWEMIRLCSILNHNIIGGASKIFKHFLNTYKPNSIITYADRHYSNGNVYKNLGFNFIENTRAGYKWTNGNVAFNRVLFQKHKLKNILTIYDKNLSERENMFNNKYRIYWDCGQSVWEYKK